jgi:hypothetical protein
MAVLSLRAGQSTGDCQLAAAGEAIDDGSSEMMLMALADCLDPFCCEQNGRNWCAKTLQVAL